MKILHICETIKGGVATYLNTFDTLCGGETDNIYLVPEHHADQLTVAGRIETFPAQGRGAGTVAALCRAALRMARAEKPDILFFQSSFSLIAMAWLRLHRVPGKYAYCPHCWGQVPYSEQPSKRRLVAAVEGRLVGLSDMVVNIAHNDRAIAEASGYRGRHIVVENALPDLPAGAADVSPYDAGETKRLNLLFVGRFDRQKGLDLLLDAFAEAVKRNPDLYLHVVGAGVVDGGQAGPVAPPRTHFHDWVPPQRIAAYYRHADLVVMPSRWEGLPMVLIEALRAGTPVMLSNRSGMEQLVEDGRSGFVLPLSVERFAEALGSVDAARLAAMRPAARALYEKRYGPDRFRRETMAALRDTLGNAGSGR